MGVVRVGARGDGRDSMHHRRQLVGDCCFFICLVVNLLYYIMCLCGWEAVGAVIFFFGFCFVRKRNCEVVIGRNKWQ